MPEFGALPPETNSARMYAGPGAGPMTAAAGAWRELAGELGSAAATYQAVIAELVGQAWFGPASQAMAAAATPYATWLAGTAAVAQHTANLLMLAVSDYQQAFAATVPPAVIAANRSLLAELVGSDVLGQNATAIAATEAEYGQMWLQDATVMYGYAARSAAATAVQPFTSPPTVAGRPDTALTGGAHDQPSALLNAIPQALRGLSGSGGAQAAPVDVLGSAQSTDPVSQGASYLETLARTVLPANDTNISVLYGMGQYARNLNTDLDISQATGGRAGFGSGATALGAVEPIGAGGRPVVAARAGNAGAVGGLAVPPAWAESVPEAATMPAATPVIAAAAPEGRSAGMAAAAMSAARRERGERANTRGERTAGRLTEVGEVRHWHAEPGGLKSLLGEVAGQPGVHEIYFDTGAPIPPDTAPPPGRG
ncbi:PPE family protein [Mycolicibacter senuensis]|uniref:Putative PPE family protein PPE30 n=1 Tax=Mycolicibacter senuensis TaxID=386913 RepID=A0A7I9XIV2_9MYCO|nr:PPE family protein [Mycolicibacter senuensis]ORW67451.1 hypothetical protein AWC24_11010 [Mycolicibacter senuensis]GFG69658.1 putative PPE family protein PPE30 [Mycolicibacter senuensis]